MPSYYCFSCGRLARKDARWRFGRPICDHRGEAAHGAPRLCAPIPETKD